MALSFLTVCLTMLPRYWYKADWALTLPVLILSLIGVVMMFSTSSIIGFSHYDDPYFFIKRHIIFLFLGGLEVTIIQARSI